MSTAYQSRHTGLIVDDGVDNANAAKAKTDLLYAGVLNLGNGVSGGTVTGLGLGFTPTKVNFTVEGPVDGQVMFATLVLSTLTVGGFQFYLSAETDTTTYRLHYTLTGI